MILFNTVITGESPRDRNGFFLVYRVNSYVFLKHGKLKHDGWIPQVQYNMPKDTTWKGIGCNF